jgi:hypothetical protein
VKGRSNGLLRWSRTRCKYECKCRNNLTKHHELNLLEAALFYRASCQFGFPEPRDTGYVAHRPDASV